MPPETTLDGTIRLYGEPLGVRCVLRDRDGGLARTMRVDRPLSAPELRELRDQDATAAERLATLDDGRRFLFRVSWTRGAQTLRVAARDVDVAQEQVKTTVVEANDDGYLTRRSTTLDNSSTTPSRRP